MPLYFCFQVANLACSMSSNEEGVKMVRLAAAEIEKLCPQVSEHCKLWVRLFFLNSSTWHKTHETYNQEKLLDDL